MLLMTAHTDNCPLCQHADTRAYAQDRKRRFLQCQHCQLVFAEKSSWPKATAEKATYDQHENDIGNEGYNRFLSRIVPPLKSRLLSGAQILDFGCGPAPALGRQLSDSGFEVSLYDHFYRPDNEALARNYDAVVLTEVIEHLHQPHQVVQKLWQQLNPGGWLAVMTQRVTNPEAFSRWQYKNDPTHVCFFTEQSFSWLAASLGADQPDYEGRDMVFLKKVSRK